VTWKTDLAAYAPCNDKGQALPRPLPEDVGRVRLRWLGLNANADDMTLVRAKGPWYSVMNQPLPGGTKINQYVGFREAWDYVIECRNNPPERNADLASVYVHVLEGYREGESSSIREVKLLTPRRKAPDQTQQPLALQIACTNGDTDTVILQPAPALVDFGSISTDAQYALVRRGADGEVREAHVVRGGRLTCGKVKLEGQGDLRGELVDLIGDLTGTRKESAFIVEPQGQWAGLEALAGRPIMVSTIAGYDEAYTIEKAAALPGGNVRVDLAGHPPLTSGWYQVATYGPDPNSLISSVSMELGLFSPWWHGCKAWFPARGRSYTIAGVDQNRVTVRFKEQADCQKDGIQRGDWFVIHALEPGNPVRVQGQAIWTP
jgi:hypothetical protein